MREEKGVLVYVVSSFPAVTTTFIINEICALRQRGWQIDILSLTKGKTDLIQPRAKELLPSTTYAKPVFSWPTLRAHFYFLFLHPLAYISTFSYIFSSRIFPWHLSELRLFIKAVYLAWVIRNRKILHIHAHFAGVNAASASIIASLLRKDFSFIAHAIGIFVFETSRSLRGLIKRAKFVLAESGFHIRYMIDKGRVDFSNKAHVLKNSVFAQDFQPKKDYEMGLPFLLTVSRLCEKKGLIYLIEAYRILKERGEEFKALIVGEGYLRQELQNKIKEYNLEDRVEINPFEDSDKIRERFSQCDVFVLPCVVASNGDMDGMPLSLIEAMASGLPVVSTPISGIPELISNEKTGFLVSPRDGEALADTLQRLLRNEDLRKKIGLAAREHILEHHNLTRNITILEELLRRGGDERDEYIVP